ncbi:MAG: hypothetical protein BJ554DRAFT_1887, partial [Olpidium bornovanus]
MGSYCSGFCLPTAGSATPADLEAATATAAAAAMSNRGKSPKSPGPKPTFAGDAGGSGASLGKRLLGPNGVGLVHGGGGGGGGREGTVKKAPFPDAPVMEIGRPTNVEHGVHVEFNTESGRFRGLPDVWHKELPHDDLLNTKYINPNLVPTPSTSAYYDTSAASGGARQRFSLAGAPPKRGSSITSSMLAARNVSSPYGFKHNLHLAPENFTDPDQFAELSPAWKAALRSVGITESEATMNPSAVAGLMKLRIQPSRSVAGAKKPVGRVGSNVSAEAAPSRAGGRNPQELRVPSRPAPPPPVGRSPGTPPSVTSSGSFCSSATRSEQGTAVENLPANHALSSTAVPLVFSGSSLTLHAELPSLPITAASGLSLAERRSVRLSIPHGRDFVSKRPPDALLKNAAPVDDADSLSDSMANTDLEDVYNMYTDSCAVSPEEFVPFPASQTLLEPLDRQRAPAATPQATGAPDSAEPGEEAEMLCALQAAGLPQGHETESADGEGEEHDEGYSQPEDLTPLLSKGDPKDIFCNTVQVAEGESGQLFVARIQDPAVDFRYRRWLETCNPKQKDGDAGM